MVGGLRGKFSRDLPLRRKILVISVLSLIATIFMSVILLIQVRRTSIRSSIASEQVLVTQTSNVLISSISRIVTAADSIQPLSLLSRAAYSSDLNEYLADTRTAVYARDFFAEVNALTDHDLITNICIYLSPDYEKIGETYPGDGILQPLDDIRNSYWYGIFSGQPQLHSLYCPDFYLSHAEAAERGQLAYIRKILSSGGKDSEVMGYMAIYFSKSAIENILMENMTGTGSVFYIVNSRENIAASSNYKEMGLYILDYNDLPRRINGDAFNEVRILDNDVYLAYRDITGTDWRLVAAIPVDQIHREDQQVLRRLTFFFILIACLSLLIQYWVSAVVANRITDVTRQIAMQTPIPLQEQGGDPGTDEVGELITTYNAMLARIGELMEEQTRSAEKLKVSEVRALQAQINPHFLYNMLDMINWLSISGNQKGVSEAVQSLSRFYKLTLSKKSIYVTIAEEIKHVELYVQLQNMRYEHKIHFLTDIPDDIRECTIPKLVLQPIVENAILHGLFEKEEKEGNIVLMAWTEPAAGAQNAADIVITISDDGVGIRPEVLEHILDGTRESTTGGTNIAVYNTHQRLILLYGPDYGLKYTSQPGEGTEVQIRIPAQRLNESRDAAGSSF